MRIELWDGKYVIKSDSRCYHLLEVKDKITKEEKETLEEVKGEKYEVAIAYPTSIEGCLRFIVAREERNNNCRTIKGFIKHISEVHSKLEEMLKELDKVSSNKVEMKKK